MSPSERETGALERWSTNQDGERSTRGHLTWHSFKGKEVSEGGWLVTGIGCANDTQTHRVWIEPVITLSFFFFKHCYGGLCSYSGEMMRNYSAKQSGHFYRVVSDELHHSYRAASFHEIVLRTPLKHVCAKSLRHRAPQEEKL